MDPRIWNLAGFNRALGYAFGVSKSGKYMMSRNGGVRWNNISPKTFTDVGIIYNFILALSIHKQLHERN